MKKILVFDMDGTIADLYNVKNWLTSLAEKDTYPYEEAKPIYDMDTLNVILSELKTFGWSIVIVSWASKETKENETFFKQIEEAKRDWLQKYDFPYDELIITEYGVSKKSVMQKYADSFQVLFDDNDYVRKDWTLGKTIDASKRIVVEELLKIVDSEVKKL